MVAESIRLDGLRFSPGCCCSPIASGCFIGGDDFQRADSTDVGANWVEQLASSGWEISGFTLINAVPKDRVIFQTPHPNGLSSMVAWADVQGSQAGDVLRVIIAWADEDNYLWSELEVAASCGYLRLWQRLAGVNTMLKETVIKGGAVGQWHKLYACYDPEVGIYGDEGRFEGRVETASLEWYTVAENVVASGTYAGLATGSLTGTASFDDFELWKEQTDDDPECPTCKQGTRSCDISSDSFDRANSTDLGCLWEEMIPGGVWAISTNALINTTPSDLVRHTVGHPDGESNLWARVLVKGWDVGDVMKLIIAYADVDNYCWVELECGASCGVMRLWQRLAGISTQLGADTPVNGETIEQWTTLEACYRSATASNDGRLYGKVTTAAGATVSIAAECDATGTMGGLGTGAITSHVLFDDFELEKLHSEANPECRTCEAPTSCIIYWDQFTGSPGSDMGCNWTVVSGVPERTGGNLRFTDEGILLCDVRHPDADIPSQQWVWVRWAAENQRVIGINGVMRIYVGWLSATEHHYVELAMEYIPHPTQPAFDMYACWVRCFKVTGGIATQIGSSSANWVNAGQFNTYNGVLNVCYMGDEIRAQVSSLGGVLVNSYVTTDSGGRHVGLGAGSGRYSAVWFDDFRFERHQTAEWEECKFCPAESSCNDCLNDTGPQFLRITLTGVNNYGPTTCTVCEDLNGSVVVSGTGCGSFWTPDFATIPGQIQGMDYDWVWPTGIRCMWCDQYWRPSGKGYFNTLTAKVGVSIVRLLPSLVWQVRGRVDLDCRYFGGINESHWFKVDVGTERPSCDQWYLFEIPWYRCYYGSPGGCDNCDFTNARLLISAI